MLKQKNHDVMLSRHGFTPAMLFFGKYPDCVSGTKQKGRQSRPFCFGGDHLKKSNPPRRRKRNERNTMNALTAERVDHRKTAGRMCDSRAKGTAPLRTHISVQIPFLKKQDLN